MKVACGDHFTACTLFCPHYTAPPTSLKHRWVWQTTLFCVGGVMSAPLWSGLRHCTTLPSPPTALHSLLLQHCSIALCVSGVDECALSELHHQGASRAHAQRVCDHVCKDELIGYTCSCKVGFRLMNDSRSCEGTNQHEPEPASDNSFIAETAALLKLFPQSKKDSFCRVQANTHGHFTGKPASPD